MTTLGVQCTSSYAFLALADGDDIVERGPERMAFRGGLEPGDQLVAFAEEAARALRDLAPARVVLLQAAGTYEAGHSAWTERIAMETLIRLEAVRAGVECRYVSQQAVRGALGLKGKGSLPVLGADQLTRVGRYWTDGRLAAALVAVTGERKA